MSDFKSKISELMKSSMKSGDKQLLSFVRNLHSAIRKKEIDDRKDLTEDEFLKIVTTSLKQLQEATEEFRNGGRTDLVSQNEAEIKFLQGFQPPQLNEAELKQLIDQSVAEAGASGIKDLGKAMKVLMPKIQGRADGKWVNQLLKQRLESP